MPHSELTNKICPILHIQRYLIILRFQFLASLQETGRGVIISLSHHCVFKRLLDHVCVRITYVRNNSVAKQTV